MAQFSSILYKLLGEKIKKRREELQLNQNDLSEKAGVGRASISNIESGRQKPPLSVIYSICNALDIDIHSVLPTYYDVEQEMNKGNQISLEQYYDKLKVDPKTQEKIASILKEFKK